MLNSEGGEFEFEEIGKGGRFERLPDLGIRSSQDHVLFNIKVVSDGLKELCWKLGDGC